MSYESALVELEFYGVVSRAFSCSALECVVNSAAKSMIGGASRSVIWDEVSDCEDWSAVHYKSSSSSYPFSR